MRASRGEFIKYPRTPHLFGSKGTDDDKHLGEAESKAFIADDSDYKARIEIVYIEPPFPRLLEQNKSRSQGVPEHVIRKLAQKCEPPTWTECHNLVVDDGESASCSRQRDSDKGGRFDV